MLKVLDVQYNWYVAAGITLDRMDGTFPCWVVAQYLDAVDLQLGDEILHATSGSVLIISPHYPHKYAATVPFRHHWMHVEGDMAALLEKYDLKTERIYPIDNAAEISQLFRAISMAYHGKDPYREECAALKIEEMLLCTSVQLHLQRETRKLGCNQLQKLQDLRNRILEHPEKDWSVANMAAELYISEAHFYAIYRQRFGVSPAQDVQNIRLEKASIMLRDKTPVAVTAELCGYHNVYHFIRQFKKKMGVTPGRYRPGAENRE